MIRAKKDKSDINIGYRIGDPIPGALDGNSYSINPHQPSRVNKGGAIGFDYEFGNRKVSDNETFNDMSEVHNLFHVKYTPSLPDLVLKYGMKGNAHQGVIDAIEDGRISYLVDDEVFPDYGSFLRTFTGNHIYYDENENVDKILTFLALSKYADEDDYKKMANLDSSKMPFIDGGTVLSMAIFLRINADNPRATVTLVNYFWEYITSEVNAGTPAPTGELPKGDILEDVKRWASRWEFGKDFFDDIKTGKAPELLRGMEGDLSSALNGVTFRIKNLPMDLNHTRGLGLRPRPVDTGVVPRYLNRYPWGPVFTQIKHFQGGTVLIDCSGSMCLGMEDIMSVLKNAPLATVALYDSNGTDGVLRIAARKGRSATGKTIELSHVGGGNVVDYYCLRWLGKQDKPRIWISDGGVTGRGDNTFKVIYKACATLCVQNTIRRIRYVSGALEYFKRIKGIRG